MDSLFDPTGNKKIIERLEKLRPDSKPLWGKMTVTQMLAHSQAPLMVAFGEHKLKRGLMGILFGKAAKKGLLKPGPFKKNLPTAPSFIVKDHQDFAEEKSKLIGLIKRFSEKGEAAISKEPHPFFGKLTPSEWDILQWKHLDHHLTQFGV